MYGRENFVCISVIREASLCNLQRSITGNLLHDSSPEILRQIVISTSGALIQSCREL